MKMWSKYWHRLIGSLIGICACMNVYEHMKQNVYPLVRMAADVSYPRLLGETHLGVPAVAAGAEPSHEVGLKIFSLASDSKKIISFK